MMKGIKTYMSTYSVEMSRSVKYAQTRLKEARPSWKAH